MEATNILSTEHRVIERVIAALETTTQALGNGKNVRPGFFFDATEFIRGFADGCHHRKEENVLFKTMEKFGVPANGGPIGVMLAEHEQGRYFVRAMRVGVESWEAGNQEAKSQVREAALGYATLLRQHIFKEDHILFPMADHYIPTEEHAKVLEDFEQVERAETGEGVHERFLALAEALAAEAQSWA